MKPSRIPAPLAVAAALSLIGPPASAQTDTASGNAVVVGGTPIMRVRVASGGYSPEQRAAQIQQRVNKFLGQGPIRPDDITVQPSGGEALVLVKGQLLFTADRATARFNQATPVQLANMWADHMRQVLPGLTQPK